MFDLCRNRNRRILLTVLAEEQRWLTLNDLTNIIVKHTRDLPVTEVSDDDVTRTKTSLHHVHLPKLASAGLIDYDSERRLVEPTPRLTQVGPQLSTLLERDPELETSVE